MTATCSHGLNQLTTPNQPIIPNQLTVPNQLTLAAPAILTVLPQHIYLNSLITKRLLSILYRNGVIWSQKNSHRIPTSYHSRCAILIATEGYDWVPLTPNKP